jgi:5-methylcytosine-specific restriction enzyme subunit McrC
MSASDASRQFPTEAINHTEYGIPIRNLWHMLLYAWNEVPLKNHATLTGVDAERAPTLDALLASILMKLMQSRLRIGLGGDYVHKQRRLQGIRGHIDFSESLKQRTFEHGEAYCEYEQYSINAPKNQIIRSTLARLVQTGQFGPDADQANTLRHRLRHLTSSLDGIDLIELTPDLIHRQQLGRNDNDYRLMLEICWLILQRQMPTESDGGHPLPVVDRDALVLHNIYERFVANFYRIHLNGWIVTPQKRLEWYEKNSNPYLPSMIPDLVLQEKSSSRMIILDTKFTARNLTPNQWGKEIFDSSHLYQLYAYLKSQEHLSEAHRNAIGILLYPAVNNRFSERIELQDYVMRVESIDLTMPWQEIETSLLELIRIART